jgi:hypothetical protein
VEDLFALVAGEGQAAAAQQPEMSEAVEGVSVHRSAISPTVSSAPPANLAGPGRQRPGEVGRRRIHREPVSRV